MSKENINQSDELLLSLKELDNQTAMIINKKIKLLQCLEKSLANTDKKLRKRTLEVASSHIRADDIAKTSLIRLFKQESIAIPGSSSFKKMMVIAARRRQLSKFDHAWLLDNKKKAYDFVDKHNIKRPKIYIDGASINDIKITENTVIKPLHGGSSKGVFIIGNNNKAFDVQNGRKISTDDVKHYILDLLKNRVIKVDNWIVEEYVGDIIDNQFTPPRDIKFYSFFGNIGLVLEVDRSSEAQYCFFNNNGEVVQPGKHKRANFIGNGFSSDELKLAKSLSENIFSPFIRIDFLKSSKGFFFGEFTPVPGPFDKFNDDFDKYLGDLYLEAESRIFSHAASAIRN
ncbi:ATP-grasp fold amidoligase family protein [Vibrio metschnikovii]|uniref:ATP-grasp fold amidoligase family protein n=1 Tax=Vibrio metschnikovii TaxID=28172 RepID=UPI003753D316